MLSVDSYKSVGPYEGIYGSDRPAISDDRIQLFRMRHSWVMMLA